MSMDLAELGFSVDSNGFVRAEKSMDGMTAAAKRTETATAKMVKQAERYGKALGLLAAAGATAMTAFTVSAVKAAIAAEEIASKFQVVFRGSVEKTNQQLVELTKTIPMTVTEMRGMASGIQDMLVPMGLARKQAAGLSVETIKLAGDIASFNNVKPAEALQAMQSALAGQSEPLRRFGIDVSQTRLKALALSEGLIGVKEEMTASARAQATFIAITRDSADAMGDAARTMDSTANQLKFMHRDITQAKEDLGQALIPAFRQLLTVLNQVGDDGLTPLQASLQSISTFILESTKVVLLAVVGWKTLAKTISDTIAIFSTFDTKDWGSLLAAGMGGNGVSVGVQTAQIMAEKAASAKDSIVAMREQMATADAEFEKSIDSIFAVISGFDSAMATLGNGVSRELEDVAATAEDLGEVIENAFQPMAPKEFTQLLKKMNKELETTGKIKLDSLDSILELDRLKGIIDPAYAALQELNAELYSLKELFDEGLISQDQFDEMAAGLERAIIGSEGLGSSLQQAGQLAGDALRTIQSSISDGSDAYKALDVAIQASNVVAAIGAILNQANGDPYTAPERMAAMAALVASLGAFAGSIGSFGSGFSDTAAKRQERQGTGTVLGDAEAKSESMVNALEITADATSELVGINRGMLNALQAMQAGIGSATGTIARAGLGSEYGFNAPDLKMLTGGAGAAAGAAIGTMFLPGIGTLIGAALGWVAGKLLGGKSKITDQGIAILGGSIAELIDGTLISAYQEIQYKKWRFGSKHTKEELAALGGDAAQQIGLVFEALSDAVREGAVALGIDADLIQQRLDAFRVAEQRISLKDLSAEEQQAEIEAVFSAIFDNLAASVVPFIGQFQQVGEGLGETLIRVATSVQVMQEAIKQFGWSVDELDPESFAKMSVGLIDLVGGIDEFINQMGNFISKFATDEHKFNIASDAIHGAFAQLGIDLPDTREGLWNLVQALDPIADAEAIARILSLTDYLDTYYNMLDDAEKKRIEAERVRADALNAEVDALIHIQGIAEGVVDMLTSLRDMIIGDLSTPEENYQRAREEAEKLAKSLETMTDADQIDATVRRIEQLTRSAYGLLDEDQKKTAGEEFLTFLDDVQAMALERLGVSADEALANTAFTPEEVLGKFNELVTDPLILVAGLQETAAFKMIEAAEYLMGQTPADFSIQQSDAPVAVVGQSADIAEAVQAGVRAGAEAMAEAAAAIVNAMSNNEETTSSNAEYIAEAIASMPSRIVVTVGSSEFNG